jgi:hypothetical protein
MRPHWRYQHCPMACGRKHALRMGEKQQRNREEHSATRRSREDGQRASASAPVIKSKQLRAPPPAPRPRPRPTQPENFAGRPPLTHALPPITPALPPITPAPPRITTHYALPRITTHCHHAVHGITTHYQKNKCSRQWDINNFTTP